MQGPFLFLRHPPDRTARIAGRPYDLPPASVEAGLEQTVKRIRPRDGRDAGQSLIPKSGYRFLEKIMLQQ
jgi:hypothetical protein